MSGWVRVGVAAVAMSALVPLGPSAEASAATTAVKPVQQTARTKPAKPVNCHRAKCIALTFDDGPGPHTARLLDTLKKNGVRVTFFLVGEMAQRRPSVVRRMAREGHEIANHTFSHPRLTELGSNEIASEIRRGKAVIRRLTGRQPEMLRPPYGLTDERVEALAGAQGQAVMLWSSSSRDWELRRSDLIVKRALKLARRDGIMLLHDIVPGTVRAIPTLLKELRKRGYTVVTVSEARRGKLPGPGERWPAR
ncbi:polysaccharide deacetylase family protein [Spongiactinospora rosea]|uniref:Polysaccharide deacetylase family protein n=1 Tax=Spongiactinospora rosea TaxID=2248750 RepID=A0A366LRE9_9ACTN|nr:polysaccharide deacetylase family protein [Spongiactinospora rosea]RBQ16486.1 polysaccharide deacetylase family protein [Spongiactinospora rosea]